jgi:hypothetical protein
MNTSKHLAIIYELNSRFKSLYEKLLKLDLDIKSLKSTFLAINEALELLVNKVGQNASTFDEIHKSLASLGKAYQIVLCENNKKVTHLETEFEVEILGIKKRIQTLEMLNKQGTCAGSRKSIFHPKDKENSPLQGISESKIVEQKSNEEDSKRSASFIALSDFSRSRSLQEVASKLI